MAHVSGAEIAVDRAGLIASPRRRQFGGQGLEKRVQAGALSHRDVVDKVAVLLARKGRQKIGLHGVGHVAEITGCLAVAVDIDRLARDHRRDPEWDHRRIGALRVLPGAEHVEIAQSDSPEAVTAREHSGIDLVDQLARPVRRKRLADTVLRLGQVRLVAIGGARGRVGETADLRVARGDQHVQEARAVHLMGRERVFKRPGHRAKGRLVQNVARAGAGRSAVVELADVALDQAKARPGLRPDAPAHLVQIAPVAGGEIVQSDDVLAERKQGFDQMRADETGCARHQPAAGLRAHPPRQRGRQVVYAKRDRPLPHLGSACAAGPLTANLLSMSPPLSRLVSGLCAVTLAGAILAGGSSQHAMISTAVAQLVSMPLLGIGLWLGLTGHLRHSALPITILGAGLAVGAAQLIPLPISLWRALPGRAVALDDIISATGSAPGFLPASLDPGGTARALVALLPAVALFLGFLALGHTDRRRLIWLTLGLGALSAVVGLAQATGSLRSFYTITNPGSALGFFANRNHFAALMYCLIPLAAALTLKPAGAAGSRSAPHGRQWAEGSVIVGAGLGFLFLVALAACESRAGLALGVVSLIGCAALLVTNRCDKAGGSSWAPGLVIVAALVALVLLQFTRIGTIANAKPGPIDEGRGAIAQTTLRAARAYFPLGTGLGAFVAIYASAEPVASLTSEYINHAHDDWAELFLEGGLPMAVVVGAFLGWLTRASHRAWLSRAPARDPSVPRAASLVLGVLLIHSTVDYPLRTAAISSLFALACALLVQPVGSGARASQNRPARTTATSVTPPSEPVADLP